MSHKATVKHEWQLASVALTDAYTDFTLSRQAINCTPAALAFYRYTAGAFLSWVEFQGVTDPQVTVKSVLFHPLALAAVDELAGVNNVMLIALATDADGSI